MEFSARMMDYMNARLATKADNSSNLVTYRYAHLVETHDFDIFFCSLKFLNKCSVVKNSAYFLSMCNSKRHTDFDIRYHEGIFLLKKFWWWVVISPEFSIIFFIFPKTLALFSLISSTTVAEQLAKYIYNCFCSNLLLLGFVFGVCVLFWFLHRTTCYSQLARKIFCSYFMYFLTTTKMVLVNVCFS